MTPFEAYKLYLALRSHFATSSYNAFKYNFKVNANLTSFENRKDKYFYEKLAKHSNLNNFLVANFSINPQSYVKTLAFSAEAEKIYKDWDKRQQSLGYIFKEELNKLDGDFNNFFIVHDNNHPIILKKYLSNDISLETLCLLVELTKSDKYWHKKLEYDPIWTELKELVVKYTPFITIDRQRIKKIVLDKYS